MNHLVKSSFKCLSTKQFSDRVPFLHIKNEQSLSMATLISEIQVNKQREKFPFITKGVLHF